MITALFKQNFYLIATVLTVAIVFLMFLVIKRQRLLSVNPLSCLLTTIFSCLLSSDYPDNIYLFERRVHKQKIKCLKLIKRHLAVDSDRGPLRLLELVIDLGQIRRRVTDHTIFALCENELVLVQDATTDLFDAITNKQGYDARFAAFSQSINQFEDVFEHVVKVAAREPLVFVLFISALREIQRQLQTPIVNAEVEPGEMMS